MALSLRKPICFVLTPFGVKVHPDSGASVDFDAIYEGTIRPAVYSAGMDAVRMDEDVAGLNQSAVQERVMIADFVVADVTTRDPAIWFLLGARAQRMPGTTLVLATRGGDMQFSNLPSIRIITYDLDEGNRLSRTESMRLRKALLTALLETLDSAPSSRDLRETDPDAEERSMRGVAIAQAIEAARDKRDVPELKRLEADLASQDPDSALLLNVYQAYGNLGDWEAMSDLYNVLPDAMQKLPGVRQQAGLALNRIGRRDEAIAMLSDLLKEFGGDSETFGLLGRIYKDQWFESHDPGALDHAIEWYMKGFEANRKDAYPGINAVTLLEIRGDAESQQNKDRLLPFVMAAVQDQIKNSRRTNYWDHATLLELAVLAGDEAQARRCAADARTSNPEGWQTETTANNLDLIRNARAQRGESQPWLDQIIAELHTSVTA